MRSLANAARAVAVLVLTPYFLSVMVMIPYYNWQYARDNGFLKWFVLGEVVPTAKALVWPYFAFVANGKSVQVKSVAAQRPVDSSDITNSPMEYTDNVYNFAFQFPSDWKLQKTPPSGEVGEVRVVV